MFVATIIFTRIFVMHLRDSVKDYCGRLDFKHIVVKYMLHFFSKVDKINNDVVCNRVLVISKEVINSNVCVKIMVLLYMTVC